MKICVLGAGVVGLTTALEIQRELPTAAVTIVADKFSRDTTSDVAAGIFRPGTSFSGPNEAITRLWIKDAFAYWEELRMSSHGSTAGVCQLSAYIFSSTSQSIVRNHYIEDVVPMYRACDRAELSLCPGNWKYGSFFTTTLTECRLFQPWAMNQFKAANGSVIEKGIDRLDDLFGTYDAVMNCTGLGAKSLVNDNKLVPIRGQIIKVKAPFVKTAFFGDYDTYIIPGFEGVTLGGCRQYDSYKTSLCRYDSAAIRERCEELVPSLKGAPVIREAVGLRPHRDPVRVESQLLETARGPLKIVHNYGHGGYGVTTAPGTAKYAVQELKKLHSGRSHL